MHKIDFVIPWVDGNDPNWLEEKEKYQTSQSSDHGSVRYRDMNNLEYFFRGIDKYAPWVNKIHFITWGHIPAFLDVNHPKINIVKHEDYIPKEYLPTFSSHPIELNLHRIKDLSEHFVYFNDDIFILNEIYPEDFFVNGLPCDQATLDYITSDKGTIFPHILLNNIDLLNQVFNKKEVIKLNKSKWYNKKYGIKGILKNLYLSPLKNFSGIKWHHLPVPYLKSNLKLVWELHNKELDLSSKSKFRNINDVNQYVFRNYQLASGNFNPINVNKLGRFYNMPHLKEQLVSDMESSSIKLFCINDSAEIENFESLRDEVIQLLEKKLPEKSSFEV